MAEKFCMDRFKRTIKGKLSIEDYFYIDSNIIQIDIKESVVNYLKVYLNKNSIEVFDCEEEIIAHYKWDKELNYNSFANDLLSVV